MGEVGTAIAIMTGLGLFFASVLALAYRFLRVEEDPRLEVVEDLLPGNNCGACGEPGCAAFAGKLLGGEVQPGKCTVASADTLEEIASFLGVDIGGEEKRIARLKCAGGSINARSLCDYQGMGSCRAAVVVDGGVLACNWGCLGLGDCHELCSACNDCVEVCPLDLFVLLPESHHLFVQCSSPLSGDNAVARCTVACDACERCALDAPPDTVEMVKGLPIVHYDRDLQPTPEATWRCPTGAIQWVVGKQFEEQDEEEVALRRGYG